MEYTTGFVVAMGLGVVFIGLVCIIIVCKIVSAVCNFTVKDKAEEKTVVTSKAVTVQPIEKRQELIAAVSAALAEELGTDVSALRILSFKKI